MTGYLLPLDLLLRNCAPAVAPRTMAAIVAVESGGDPYAINDDQAGRSYAPGSLSEALRIARRLEALGHNYDAGIAQVNSANFAAYGLSARDAFDACANLRAGSRILVDAFREASRLEPAQDDPRAQRALFRAFSIYNSGSPSSAPGYARRVIDTARRDAMFPSAAWMPARPLHLGFSPDPQPGLPGSAGFRITRLSLEVIARRAGL